MLRARCEHVVRRELALLTDEPRKATVRAGPAGCRCLKLGRDVFNQFASQCMTILDQRRKQYAAVHSIDVSPPALESYRARKDLQDKKLDSREHAPPPSMAVLNLLCKVLANAPARVKTTDAGFQELNRRISKNGQTLELLENDIVMLSNVLREAMNRVGTTFVEPGQRAEQLEEEQEQEEQARVAAVASGKASITFGPTKTSDGSVTPSVRSTPTKQLATPGTRTALGTPSGNTASMVSPAMPSVDPKAELDAEGNALYALNRSQRHHVRNFLAIARDVQTMFEKYGFSADDILAPFRDPTRVFGRAQGGGTIPFITSKPYELTDLDRLLVVVKSRLRPHGDRSPAEEAELKSIDARIETDQQMLESMVEKQKVEPTRYGPARIKNLEAQCRASKKKKQLLADVQPFGSAAGYRYPLTRMEGHSLAELCKVPKYQDLLTDKRYDGRRAARLVSTLLEGLLLDPEQPRKLHCEQTGRLDEFEEVQPYIQQDFAFCFKQLASRDAGREMLLEDERVLEYLCDVAVEGLLEKSQQYAKDALAALKPKTATEKLNWYTNFNAVGKTGKWPLAARKSPQHVQPRQRSDGHQQQQQEAEQQNPHHVWAGSGQAYAKIIAAETKAEIDSEAAAAATAAAAAASAGGIPEGDPSSAKPTAAPPAILTGRSSSPASEAADSPRQSPKSFHISAAALEQAASKAKVRKGMWGKVKGGGGGGLGGSLASRPKGILLNVKRQLSERERVREGSDLCDFFEAALEPFARMYLETDNFAMRVTNQWATVEYRDIFQMKICAKVFVQAYDAKSQLFLVRIIIWHHSLPLLLLLLPLPPARRCPLVRPEPSASYLLRDRAAARFICARASHCTAAAASCFGGTRLNGAMGSTCSGEYIFHTSEIQTGWSPRSERPFQR
jgi:CRP-like cAMP-binding protein